MGHILENDTQALINERAIMHNQLERQNNNPDMKIRSFDIGYHNGNHYAMPGPEHQFNNNNNNNNNNQNNNNFNHNNKCKNEYNPELLNSFNT